MHDARGPDDRDVPFVRSSDAADSSAIAEIYVPHVATETASFEIEPPSANEMRDRRASLLERGYPHLVAELDGRVAGFAYAGLYRARAAYRTTVESSVYVPGDCVRRGVGHRLMRALVNECASRGFRQMIAIVADPPNVASVRLHERLGSRSVGILREVGRKHDRWIDAMLFRLALGPDDR